MADISPQGGISAMLAKIIGGDISPLSTGMLSLGGLGGMGGLASQFGGAAPSGGAAIPPPAGIPNDFQGLLKLGSPTNPSQSLLSQPGLGGFASMPLGGLLSMLPLTPGAPMPQAPTPQVAGAPVSQAPTGWEMPQTPRAGAPVTGFGASTKGVY